MVEQFDGANVDSNSYASSSDLGQRKYWKMPKMGCTNINFDATFTGIGVECYNGYIARDDKGRMLKVWAGGSGIASSVVHAETIATKKAFFFGGKYPSMKFHFIIEGGCLQLITELQKDTKSFISCGHLTDDIKQ